MSDIVERLRRRQEPKGDGKGTWIPVDICQEAAGEIAALRSALSDARAESRREALEEAVAIADELDPNADDVAAAIRALMQQGERT